LKSKTLSSRDNPLYKELKQLAGSGQARRKAGLSLLDGVHLCASYVDAKGLPRICAVSETSLQHKEVAPLLARCEASSETQCIVLSESLYDSISQVEHGVGLTFVIDTPQGVVPRVLHSSAVLLDRLQDPGNLGSILRSAAAAGIRHVFCSSETVQAWSPKVLRAGMGAHFLLNIVEQADLLRLVGEASIPVLGTSSHASTSLYAADLRGETAWLFGHEGKGVDESLLNLASGTVVIPHRGAVESLNVAASAAICFFEQLRQQSASPT
jgi:TrmH family RNA methyltransferase